MRFFSRVVPSILVAALIVAAAVSAPLSATAVSSAPTPVVQGNHLVDSRTNTTFIPRGVNIPGLEYSCVQGWRQLPETGEYAALTSWKINTVRLPLNESCWLGLDGAPSGRTVAQYQADVKTWVDGLTAAGLVVILDLHWNAPAGYTASGQRAMPDARSASFWSSVATTYAANKSVMFELFNEPYSRSGFTLTWDCWKNGGCLAPVENDETGTLSGAKYTVTGMQTLVTTVRTAGATQPLLLGGLNYSNDLTGWIANKPTDPLNQLVVAWHNYPGQGCSTSCWNSTVTTVAASVPIVTTEFGNTAETGSTAVGNSGNYLVPFMTWAEAHGIGYLPWAWWDVGAAEANGNGSDVYALFSGSSFTPKAPSGTKFHDYLAQLAPDAIVMLHDSLGGDAGVLGPAQSGRETFTGHGGGVGQRFLNGSIMSSPTAGTFAIMNGSIRNTYFNLGGPSSAYGWPTAAQACVGLLCTQQFQGGVIQPDAITRLQLSLGGDAGTLGPAQSGVESFAGHGGGTGQRFLNGSIMSSPTAGTFAIMNGSIRNTYFNQGGPSSALGWPIAAQTCVAATCAQQFQGGSIPGAIALLQLAMGGDAGTMGPAQSGIETFAGHGGGIGQRFLNGSIMSSPTAGTFAIMNGSIRNTYFNQGGPSSSLGWPIAAQVCSGGTCSQQFQGGSIPGAIGLLQIALGGDAGTMGPAQSGIETFAGHGGGTGQRFLNGSIMSSPTAGTFAIMNGSIRNTYFGQGGPDSVLGWPTAAQVCSGGVCSQQFQGGSIPHAITLLQLSMGGDAGAMGPAMYGLESFSGHGGGVGQRFVNGSIMSSPTAGTFAIMNGPIRNDYFTVGGPSSGYGWPTAAQSCVGAVCSQQFQGGVITH